MPFVTDTHPLVYFTGGRHKKLSERVLKIFRRAEAGQEVIYIPVLVFMEIDILRRKGKIDLADGGLALWVRELLRYPGFVAQDVTLEILLESIGRADIRDPIDSLIAATARDLELQLITADEQISESAGVEIYW